MINETNQELLERIVDEWSRAERTLKLSEQSTGLFVLPAIAELRYAGRSIVEFLAAEIGRSNNQIPQKESLQRALAYIANAKNDAVDVMVSKATSDISEAIRRSGLGSIPEAEIDIQLIKKIQKKIAQSRSDGSFRNEIYQTIIDEDIDNIFELLHKYSYLNLEKEQKLDVIHNKILSKSGALLVASSGLISAILGLILALLVT